LVKIENEDIYLRVGSSFLTLFSDTGLSMAIYRRIGNDAKESDRNNIRARIRSLAINIHSLSSIVVKNLVRRSPLGATKSRPWSDDQIDRINPP